MSYCPGDNPTVAIVGGGAAGMSCALWLKHLGFSHCIIERNAELGGQMLNIHRINRWVLGWYGRTSADLANAYGKHVKDESIPVIYNAKLASVESTPTGFSLMVDEAGQSQGLTMQVNALVIATGLQAQGIEIFRPSSGLEYLHSNGLIGCHPLDHLDKLDSLQGKTVAVIGGGDNAHFTVKDVARVASRVYLLIRSQAKAQQTIRNEVKTLIGQGLVVEFVETEVDRLQPTQGGIEMDLKQSGLPDESILVDRVFVRAGFVPNSRFLDTLGPLAKMSKLKQGYLLTDSRKRTSIDSVYGIGDVASPHLQSVVTAIADGAIAARAIADDIGINI